MDWSVTYNSYEIGGSTARLPIEGFDYRETDREVLWGVEFILRAATVADYGTAEATMLAALKAPEKAWSIAHGATTLYSGSPAASSATAFVIQPTIRRMPDERFTTDRSERWRLEVVSQRPAPSADGYRRDARWGLSYTSSRQKLLTISGTYTAGNSDTAYEQHTANFGTYRDAVLAQVGGTFELISEGPLEAEHRDGLIAFSAAYRQINYSTSASGVRNEQITFARRRQRKASPTRPTGVISYRAAVDRTVTAETSLNSLADTIRTTLLSKAATMFSADACVVEREERPIVSSDNVLSLTLEVLLVASSYTYRRRAQTIATYDAARRITVTLVGTYTTDGSDTALSNYTADIGTWATAALATVHASATWELVGEGPLGEDDDREEVSFVRVYRQVLHTTSGSGVRGESFGFSRLVAALHGKPGTRPALRGAVNYSCSVDNTVTDKDGLVGLYNGTLRPALISRIASQYGGTVIVEEERLNADPGNNTISAELRVILKGVGSDLLTYTETRGFVRVPVRVRKKLWDGKRQTYHWWLIDHVVMAAVVAESQRLGATNDEPEGDPPAAAPAAFGVDASGTWVLDGPQEVQVQTVEVGRSPVGSGGSQTLMQRKTSATRFIWMAEGSQEVGSAADTATTVPREGALAEESGLTGAAAG